MQWDPRVQGLEPVEVRQVSDKVAVFPAKVNPEDAAKEADAKAFREAQK